MSAVFSKPPAPLPPAPPPPTPEDPEVEAARKRAHRAALNARGRAATILTGGQGLTGDTPANKKTLLGA
jgi:hypothetical protein